MIIINRGVNYKTNLIMPKKTALSLNLMKIYKIKFSQIYFFAF